MTDAPFSESALVFACEGEQLIGVVATPADARKLGVVIAVGGPQYRVGSHRQFVLLARRLASRGFTVLRFDYRGMGDSTGAQRSFESIDADLRAAVDALLGHNPHLERVVLWGLCDAASTVLMYAPADERVAGLVLANPWARGADTLAQTHLKHYYLSRLLSGDFWTKLFKGRLRIRQAVSELGSNIARSRGRDSRASQDFRFRMLEGLERFRGPVLLILSGQDLTAQEFRLFMNSEAGRRRLLERSSVTRVELSDADHTFSSSRLRQRVEDETTRWLLGTASALPTR